MTPDAGRRGRNDNMLQGIEIFQPAASASSGSPPAPLAARSP